MIYIYKKQSKIFITDTPREINLRDEEFSVDSELLYTKSWDSLEKIYSDLRYYMILKDGPGWYKDCSEVKSYISKEDNSETYNVILAYVYKQDIYEIIEKFQETLKYLISIKNLPEIYKEININELIPLIEYKCDIINILYDLYGSKVVSRVRNFQHLSEQKKRFITDFYKLETRDKKSDYIRAGISRIGISEVQEFIPDLYNLEFSIFKTNPKERVSVSETPEFLNQNRIDGRSEMIRNQDYFIRNEVYQVFGLGEVWEGKKIKEELNKIYEKFGIEKNSRVHDIFSFFETAITRKGYRLVTRK